jgi:acyl carrier protein
MLHTLVGDDEDAVKELVRQPMKDYLRSAVFLVKDAAWNFPTFQKLSKETGQTIDEFFANAGPEDMDAILEFAFERYFQRSGLLGSVEKCVAMVDRIKEIGAQEIGCLIDFGAPRKQVMEHLPHLAEVLRLSASRAAGEDADFGIPALIQRHKVTHMQCTPSQAKMLAADSDMHKSLGALNTFMVGGEALPQELAEELGGLSGARLINMYGPTETTIWSSTQELDGGDGPIPIGTPIANTSIYILDEHHQPVPIGVPGELVIGGDGVVPGYHQRSELTAEKFLPDPFSKQKNATMYRTGDLARWRDDGVVEFLGRMDFQVKIRGYRIELGEIESGLQAHDSVEQAVVLLREDVPGDKRLIAYILPAMGHEIDEQELKQTLLKEMPDFMVPSGFVVLDSIPLTLNGKIDRKALPAPVAPTRADSSGFEAPASDTELMVATIWKKALNREDIGLDDNFFDIGGHSLLAIEVLQTLREQAGKPIQMTTLFQYTTVRTLARFLSGDQDDGQGAADSKARADKRRAALGRRRRRS